MDEHSSLLGAKFSSLDARILSHYPQIRSIQHGEIPFPRMAEIYPMYGCNLDCVGCEYTSDNQKGFKRLDTARGLSLIDELADGGTEAIEFCGGGEPSLHPSLTEFVLRGGARGIKFSMLTNGTTLTPHFLSEALPHFSYLRLTLDAADAAMYARTRPAKSGNPWEKVLGNFRALVAERKRQGLEKLAVSAKFLLSKINAHQLEAMAALACELGASSAQFKALRLDPNELSAEEANDVEHRLVRLRATSPIPVLGSVGKIVMTKPCILTPLQVTIDAHGDVYLCCYFTHRKERHSIGNISQMRFSDVWGADRHRAAIAGIQPKECSNLDCRFVRYHDVVDKWMSDEANFSFI